MCFYAYDDFALHTALLDRVESGKLRLKLIVDGRYLYGSSAPYYSMSRLQALNQHTGAEIKTGGSAASNMHYKIAWLSGPNDFAIAYHGGSNATQASRKSWECVTRHLDPDMTRQFKEIAEHCFDKGIGLRML